MLHESHPPAGEVAKAALRLGVDVARRQDAQPHQMREPERVVLIVGVLEPAVLLHRRSAHQAHLVSGVHQAVDQPVRIERRLDRNRRQPRAKRLEHRDRSREFVRQSSLVDAPIRAVNHRENMVVGMQVNPAVECHGRPLLCVAAQPTRERNCSRAEGPVRGLSRGARVESDRWTVV